MDYANIKNNRKAFLTMIAIAEGTAILGDSGYNVLVGGSLFTGYADHPRKAIYLPKYKIKSTAAGRYQILSRYYDFYKKLLKLKDFSPASQDAIAIQMIKEQHALQDVDDGKLDAAVEKVSNIWASLPGAGYGQREVAIVSLRKSFVDAGGLIA